MGFKYNENCNSIYGGVILQPYTAVFLSNIAFFIFQYLVVNFVFPVVVHAYHFGVKVHQEYHNLRFLHMGEEDRTEIDDFLAAVYLALGYHMTELQALQWWNSIMNEEHNDHIDLISLFPVTVPTPEEYETERMYKRMEASFGYYYAFFLCQLVWVIFEVCYYIGTSQAEGIYSHRGQAGSGDFSPVSAWIQYNYFIGFLSNSSYISLVYMAFYVCFMKELYFPFRYYWAESAQADDIVYYIPHLYEAHPQRIYCVKIISVDAYINSNGVVMGGSGFGAEMPTAQSLFDKSKFDDTAYTSSTCNNSNPNPNTEIKMTAVETVSSGTAAAKTKSKTKGNSSSGKSSSGSRKNKKAKSSASGSGSASTMRLTLLQRLSDAWARTWARRREGADGGSGSSSSGGGSLMVATAGQLSLSATKVAPSPQHSSSSSGVLGSANANGASSSSASSAATSPGLPLYMTMLNDRKTGYELPYYLREDLGKGIKYIPPPSPSEHRFGHRYYIQFLDDIYHHQPRKVTFLHLFHSHSAAKLELQFHRYEHMFEPFLLITMILSLPLVVTHLIPGLLMYIWVVIVWVFVGTLIGLAVQVIWFALGPGLSFDCTDELKRQFVSVFMSKLLLRVIIVLVIQTLVNYMSLYYIHMQNLADSSASTEAMIMYNVTGNATSVTTIAVSVSGGYINNMLVEFNLRTQSLYPCFLAAAVDGQDYTATTANTTVGTDDDNDDDHAVAALYVVIYNVFVTLNWL